MGLELITDGSPLEPYSWRLGAADEPGLPGPANSVSAAERISQTDLPRLFNCQPPLTLKLRTLYHGSALGTCLQINVSRQLLQGD